MDTLPLFQRPKRVLNEELRHGIVALAKKFLPDHIIARRLHTTYNRVRMVREQAGVPQTYWVMIEKPPAFKDAETLWKRLLGDQKFEDVRLKPPVGKVLKPTETHIFSRSSIL